MEIERDIYLKWKDKSKGRKTLLIEGTRCVGKSTIAVKLQRNNSDPMSSSILITHQKRSEIISNWHKQSLNSMVNKDINISRLHVKFFVYQFTSHRGILQSRRSWLRYTGSSL